ncbi:hypothetical protein KN815_45745 [Streptomyces sp. 4503]|uniref:Uncharacterized protein n=1 Tax=Streptomyces niphimycinicus TaxID=2842201 RepID=A0ABS6CVX6_9ACTN|nr:hypothetical protein [Streptomyces niphimycinicus]MBU3871101.1 hypothetical protein [Streptomyces niphimycinicus]
MTDTPVPYESTSPAVLAHSAENTEVTGATGATGVVEIAERARIVQRAGATRAAEAVQPPAEGDDLVIEDLSDAAWPIGAPAICICTVGVE